MKSLGTSALIYTKKKFGKGADAPVPERVDFSVSVKTTGVRDTFNAQNKK